MRGLLGMAILSGLLFGFAALMVGGSVLLALACYSVGGSLGLVFAAVLRAGRVDPSETAEDPHHG